MFSWSVSKVKVPAGMISQLFLNCPSCVEVQSSEVYHWLSVASNPGNVNRPEDNTVANQSHSHTSSYDQFPKKIIWDVIIHSCPDFNSTLDKPMKLWWHGISNYTLIDLDVVIYPSPKITPIQLISVVKGSFGVITPLMPFCCWAVKQWSVSLIIGHLQPWRSQQIRE